MRMLRPPCWGRNILAALCCALAGACGELPGLYKIDIDQGNFIRAEQVLRLREGMSREQVRFILGEPLLQNTFNLDQWHYLYFLRRSDGGEPVQRLLRVSFADDNMLGYEVNFSLEEDEEALDVLAPQPQLDPEPIKLPDPLEQLQAENLEEDERRRKEEEDEDEDEDDDN